jgi:hypothetical protein
MSCVISPVALLAYPLPKAFQFGVRLVHQDAPGDGRCRVLGPLIGAPGIIVVGLLAQRSV